MNWGNILNLNTQSTVHDRQHVITIAQQTLPKQRGPTMAQEQNFTIIIPTPLIHYCKMRTNQLQANVHRHHRVCQNDSPAHRQPQHCQRHPPTRRKTVPQKQVCHTAPELNQAPLIITTLAILAKRNNYKYYLTTVFP